LSRSLFPAFLVALAAAFITLVSAVGTAEAIEPIKIARDDVALDLSGAVEIYRAQGDAFQVSTAPDVDGIVRRIEVEAQDERSTGDWAVFALANTTDQQLDRLIVAPHFRLVGSGLVWPDLGSQRIAAITPSSGFTLDRQESPDADEFHVTLNPGSVVTFVAELSSPNLPQVYLWDPGAYKDTVNAYTLFRGIVIGIAGLLALFLTILFVVKGTSMFPATAALAWAVGRSDVDEIDKINILRATMKAMERAVHDLKILPERVLVDGNQSPDLPSFSVETIIKGDDKIAAISAASIIAKVTRDEEMIRMDTVYPGYEFARHKGYGSKLHIAKLNELGASLIHRRSFAPVRRVMKGTI